jgi:hypothetical protein
MTTATPPTALDRRSPAPWRARLLRRDVVLAAALSLLAAACGDDDDTTAAGDSAGGGGGGGEMTIDFTAPADGDEVTVPFEVQVDPSVDIGEPDTGLHHVHLYYDGNISDDQSEYDILYSDTLAVDRDLGPGEHTLEAVVANADHSLTDTRAEITVTVGEGGAGSGGSDTTDTTAGDSNGGY